MCIKSSFTGFFRPAPDAVQAHREFLGNEGRSPIAYAAGADGKADDIMKGMMSLAFPDHLR
jgi:hypothetical protein